MVQMFGMVEGGAAGLRGESGSMLGNPPPPRRGRISGHKTTEARCPQPCRPPHAASALNHPNICTIYEIGEHEGKRFLAMEFLDGLTLKHMIAGRPLENQTLVTLAIEMATPLDAAHSKASFIGTSSPANIFRDQAGARQDSRFGLAKVTATARSSSQVASENTNDPHRSTNPPDQSGDPGWHGGLYVAGQARGRNWMPRHRSVPLERCCTRWPPAPCGFGGDTSP